MPPVDVIVEPKRSPHIMRVFFVLLPVLLAACSSTSVVHKPAKELCTGTKRPYQIQGVEYVPQDHYHYDEEGDASWYGPGFNKRPTACGSIYDMHAYTAAHKTLPIPSVVEVTNVESGRQLRLVVNDRGPFVGDRIIDLSKKAAQDLGTHGKGVAKVRVRTLPEDSVALANYLKQYGRYGIDPSGRPWDVIYQEEIAGKPFSVQETVMHEPSVIETAYEYENDQADVKKLATQTSPTISLADSGLKGKDAFDTLLEEICEKETDSVDIIHEEVKNSPRSIKRGEKKSPNVKKTVQKLSGKNNHKPSGYFVEVGSFVNKNNANKIVPDLSKYGKAHVVQDKEKFYTVKLGPFSSQDRAVKVVSSAIKEGHYGAHIKK